MKIITVSREFGSGGRELGKRLADLTGFDYYDSEIISAIAKNSGLDAKYIENTLQNSGWQAFPVSYRCTLSSTSYTQAGKVELLLEQKRVIEQIATMNKDFIIVGRNADIILNDYQPFNIFVCAALAAKITRCRNRAPEGEQLSEKELVKKIKQIDKQRAQTREILSGGNWGDPSAYHLTVNTTDWNIKDLTPAVADFATHWFRRNI